MATSGTVVLFHINDSSGTLAETTHFVVENGKPANAFLASPGSARVNVTSSTGSTTPSSTPIPASPTSGSTSPPGSTVSETGASSKSSVAVAAIVTPISVVVLALVAGLVFLLWKRSRRFGNPPIEDPESIAGQSSPIDQYPSEKILPAVPTQPQVTAEELQRAIDRIQEMYAIMRQAQRSSASAGDSGRVVELQRQIEDLMADNAVLSGEAPPNYDP
ncbi:hypothetical protein B0H17DRAFT_1136856 [Mycena rosella]|uniref:Uncharacterized protein n=1 Tax=Mycena rosella TaxID=1033263 RepID=A0AAD7GFL2_MYCRO|nr:hypothetical protein B0H17DRAFT_1136856 [Mycena rosella]